MDVQINLWRVAPDLVPEMIKRNQVRMYSPDQDQSFQSIPATTGTRLG